MIFKWIFDRITALLGLLILWPVLLIVAIMVKIKMPGGPVFFVQKRVGKGGKLFNCHKFRTMTVNHNGSTVSVAGDSRITPLGAKLRHYKLDELPGLWDVLIGNMSFVGPRPDVPGYADKLEGDDRDVLKLRPGITGPATLKYRLEDEMISDYVRQKQAAGDTRPMQEIATEYNDTVIYPDKVRLNCYYYFMRQTNNRFSIAPDPFMMYTDLVRTICLFHENFPIFYLHCIRVAPIRRHIHRRIFLQRKCLIYITINGNLHNRCSACRCKIEPIHAKTHQRKH